LGNGRKRQVEKPEEGREKPQLGEKGERIMNPWGENRRTSLPMGKTRKGQKKKGWQRKKL